MKLSVMREPNHACPKVCVGCTIRTQDCFLASFTRLHLGQLATKDTFSCSSLSKMSSCVFTIFCYDQRVNIFAKIIPLGNPRGV